MSDESVYSRFSKLTNPELDKTVADLALDLQDAQDARKVAMDGYKDTIKNIQGHLALALQVKAERRGVSDSDVVVALRDYDSAMG